MEVLPFPKSHKYELVLLTKGVKLILSCLHIKVSERLNVPVGPDISISPS